MLVALIIALIISSNVFAQIPGFSIHAGGVFPNGDFAEGDEKSWALLEYNKLNSDAGAATGFNLGIKSQFAIPSVKGLNFLASVDFMYNGMNSDIKDVFDEIESDAENFEYSLPKYMNIPIMLGLNYSYGLNDKIKLFGEFAAGINIRKITDLSYEGTFTDYYYDEWGNYYSYTYDAEETLTYDIKTTFAFQLGGGVLFADRFSVGLHYYALGEAKVQGDIKYDYGDETEKEKFKYKDINPSMLVLRIGLHF